MIFLSLAVYLSLSIPVYAQVFQYFDQDGTLIVTDDPYGIKKKNRSSSAKTKPASPEKPDPSPDYSYKPLTLTLREEINYDYYPVTGNTFQEALLSTKINGPFDEKERKTFAALTQWTLGWSYEVESSYKRDGAYVLASVNIYDVALRSDITVLLPMLSENITFNQHDSELWRVFLQELLEHEHDHVDIILHHLYSDDLFNELKDMKEITLFYEPHLDIKTEIKNAVQAETMKIGHELIQIIKKDNEEYDRITDHGRRSEMRKVFFNTL